MKGRVSQKLAACLLGASILTQPMLRPSRALAKAPRAHARSVERAVASWQKGEFSKARRLLSRFEGESLPKADPATIEVALRYLADAALLDPTLDESSQQAIAGRAIRRLFEQNAQWMPPNGVHGNEFYQLSAKLRAERNASSNSSCRAERQACTAELAQLSHERGQLLDRQAKMRSALAQQNILVERHVARNRAVALLPAGIGHMYNGRRKLGFAFLGTEVALGASALGLLLYRVYGLGCRRTQGFAPGSLRCDVPPDQARHTKQVRNAEQIVGVLFFSSLIADVVTAQITFRAHSVYKHKRKRANAISRVKLQVTGQGLGLHSRF